MKSGSCLPLNFRTALSRGKGTPTLPDGRNRMRSILCDGLSDWLLLFMALVVSGSSGYRAIVVSSDRVAFGSTTKKSEETNFE